MENPKNKGLNEINYCKKSEESKILYCRQCGIKMIVPIESKRRYCRASCGMYLKRGVWNASQSEEIQIKMKKSKADNYGEGDYKKACRAIYEKIKESTLEHHGYENPSQIPGSRDKAKSTVIRRYDPIGEDYKTACRNIAEIQKEKCEKRPCQLIDPDASDRIKERRKNTIADRSGDGDYGKAREGLSQRRIDGYGNKTGYDFPSHNPEVREQIRSTNLKRYGVEWFTQTEEFKAKAKETNRKKYGVEYVSQSESIQKKIETTSMERYGVKHYISTVKSDNMNTISATNRKWHDLLLDETGIDFDYECAIDSKNHHRADLGFEDLLIDINPTISHLYDLDYRCVIGKCGQDNHSHCHEGKPKDYHLNRYEEARSNNKRLIQIWDWDNEKAIISDIRGHLRQNRMIYDEIHVIRIDRATALSFIMENNDSLLLSLPEDSVFQAEICGDSIIGLQAYVVDEDEIIILANTIKNGVDIRSIGKHWLNEIIKRHPKVKTITYPVDLSLGDPFTHISGFQTIGMTGSIRLFAIPGSKKSPISGENEDSNARDKNKHVMYVPGFSINRLRI